MVHGLVWLGCSLGVALATLQRINRIVRNVAAVRAGMVCAYVHGCYSDMYLPLGLLCGRCSTAVVVYM